MSKEGEDKVRFPHIGEIDKSLLETMEQDAKQRGFPDMSTYIRKAVKHFSVCKENEASQAMKQIITKFPGKCLKCGHDVPVNSWAMYGKGVGLVCLDCVVLKLGDKTLVTKYLKNRELERVWKSLKEECDGLAGQVEQLQILNKAEDLKNQQEETIKLIRSFLTTNMGTDQEREALDVFLRQLEDGKRIIRDLDIFIKNYVRNRKWRKQIRERNNELPEEEEQQHEETSPKESSQNSQS